jgi:hypothetical protein
MTETADVLLNLVQIPEVVNLSDQCIVVHLVFEDNRFIASILNAPDHIRALPKKLLLAYELRFFSRLKQRQHTLIRFAFAENHPRHKGTLRTFFKKPQTIAFVVQKKF